MVFAACIKTMMTMVSSVVPVYVEKKVGSRGNRLRLNWRQMDTVFKMNSAR